MRDMMWIYAAFILLLSEAWSLGPGTNHNISASYNDSSIGGDVLIYSIYNEGSDVNLTCSNKTWNETLYVIWTIQLKYRKECQISLNDVGRSVDTCKDGKSLYTSSTQSYLHIPDFTNGDEGVYKCEWVYKGGSDRYEINVAITVPPRTSAWLEQEENKMVAVCKAERGKPAANIFWSHAGNLTDVKTSSDKDGFFTVVSRLEIPEGMDTENLSCAISHPYWRDQQNLEPKLARGHVIWLCISAVAGLVFLAAVVFFAQKKLMILRRCQQSDSSPSKTAPTEDVEEVEPYASYVQRVNSIYNSSADLFT